ASGKLRQAEHHSVSRRDRASVAPTIRERSRKNDYPAPRGLPGRERECAVPVQAAQPARRFHTISRTFDNASGLELLNDQHIEVAVVARSPGLRWAEGPIFTWPSADSDRRTS